MRSHGCILETPSLWPHLNNMWGLVKAVFLVITTHLSSQVEDHWGRYLNSETLQNPKPAECWQGPCDQFYTQQFFMLVGLNGIPATLTLSQFSPGCAEGSCEASVNVMLRLKLCPYDLIKYMQKFQNPRQNKIPNLQYFWFQAFQIQGTKHTLFYYKPNSH